MRLSVVRINKKEPRRGQGDATRGAETPGQSHDEERVEDIQEQAEEVHGGRRTTAGFVEGEEEGDVKVPAGDIVGRVVP